MTFWKTLVKILNQNYDVYCDENEREMLMKSAELLNDKMMKTKAEGKTIGLDRYSNYILNFHNTLSEYKFVYIVLFGIITLNILRNKL